MMTDDQQTIRRILAGEFAAFRLLVERYEKPLFCQLRNLLGNHADCEEIAQEVFLTAYRNLAAYRPESAQFSTWLFVIARNKCLNRINKRQPILVPVLPEHCVRRPPEADLEQAEFFRQLDDALDALPLEQKSAFVLAEIQERPYEEISRIEGVRVGTVKSRVSRAREKLRALLGSTAGFCNKKGSDPL